jgi:homoserine O-acetyltransferase
MAALLTYRSRDSLERRFGREISGSKAPMAKKIGTSRQKNRLNHNGNASHQLDGTNGNHQQAPLPDEASTAVQPHADESYVAFEPTDSNFAAQSYLRYQSKKFSSRFDSNCYVALTQKLDTHDLSRGRADNVTQVLSLIEQPTLVLGIRSDGLYTLSDQEQIARCVPNATLREIVSDDGHDAFLIESHQINWLIIGFLYESLPDIMRRPVET